MGSDDTRGHVRSKSPNTKEERNRLPLLGQCSPSQDDHSLQPECKSAQPSCPPGSPGPGLPHGHSSPAGLAASLLSTRFRACRQFLSPGHLGTSHRSRWVLGSFLTFSPFPAAAESLSRKASPGPSLLYSAPKKSAGSSRLSLDRAQKNRMVLFTATASRGAAPALIS